MHLKRSESVKLIKHMIFVDIDDGNKLMINSLRGTLDEINAPIYETLSKWRICEDITPENELETELFHSLKARGYLVDSYLEEIEKKEAILEVLRKNHKVKQENQLNITFVMTYDCNFRCPYCFEGDAHVKKAIISPEQIDTALKLAGNSLNNICLFGGEPLLPKTRTIVEYLFSKAPSATYNIITNGYYLEEFIDLLLDVKIHSVMVTIDGEEEHHNSRRFLEGGEATYQKIMSGIEKSLENSIPICIRMNVDKNNYNAAVILRQKLLDKFDKYKDILTFETSPILGMDHNDMIELQSKISFIDEGHAFEERIRRNRLLDVNGSIIDYLTLGKNIKPKYSFCYAHEDGMVFDPYGDLYPCLVCVGNERYPMGKYHPEFEIKENTIRNRHIEKIPECNECIYSLLCGGGCPMKLPDVTNFFRPVCSSIKNQIYKDLPVIYKIRREHNLS